jgi:hypothetical protein
VFAVAFRLPPGEDALEVRLVLAGFLGVGEQEGLPGKAGLTAFKDETALPSSVCGPVESCAFARLAARRRSLRGEVSGATSRDKVSVDIKIGMRPNLSRRKRPSGEIAG